MMAQIYFDHAATAPMHPQVIEEMMQEMKEVFGNPSSVHEFGRIAHQRLENARQIIADALVVKPHEIIFNSGGTEGDNTAIIQTAMSKQAEGRHILTTAIEHPAVMNTMKYLETQGFEVTYLPVDKQGQLSVSAVEKALRPDTILVSVMFVNNEVGTILPIEAIGQLLAKHHAVFHTDAVQAFGIQNIRPHDLGIDLMSVSAHKFNGPKGTGFLFKSDKVRLPPLFHGGEQEEKRRAGTENLPAILGMGKAVSLLTENEKLDRSIAYQIFNEKIIEAFDQAGIDYQINGDFDRKSPHILNLRFPGIRNDLLLMKLDLRGIAVSAGSACTAGTVDPSHVLEAMYGKGSPSAKESIRVSFGLGNTEEDAERFAKNIIEILSKEKHS